MVNARLRQKEVLHTLWHCCPRIRSNITSPRKREARRSSPGVYDTIYQDKNNSNNIILIYKQNSIPKDDFASDPSENDFWNREHVWAKSLGGFDPDGQFGLNPAYSDLHNIKPSDKTVNTSKSNKSFDQGGEQHEEAIQCFFTNYTWEPPDNVKGDIARILFYMDVRYEGDEGEPDLTVVEEVNTFPNPEIGNLRTLIIWHLQDLVTDRYFSFNKHILNYLANRIADYIICDGQIIKEALRGPILNRTFVVLNGIKTDDLKRCSKARIETRRELGIPVNAYVIGHLARIKPWKGQGNLLNAFIDYSKENLNSYLILAGSPLFGKDKYYRYLKEIIIKNNLENRVSMPGYRSDLGNLFSAMDFFVYPSIEKDTSPLALLSALCSGLPVAMSQIDSLKDVVSNCPSIDLFNVNDNDNLVRLMEKYENPILRNKNGIKNKKYAKYNFNISNHTKHITKIFKTI